MGEINHLIRNRFANSMPIEEPAFAMPRISGDVTEAAQKAAQALFATRIPVDGESAAGTLGADLAKPLLAAPAAPIAKGMSGAAMLTQLLGELNLLLGQSGQSELDSRLSVFREMADARQKSLVKVSNEFEQAVAVTEDAAKLYEAAKGEVATAESKAANAREQAAAAELELASVEEDDPSRPQLLQKNEAAQKTLLAATQKLNVAVDSLKRHSADVTQKLKLAADLETRANTAVAAAPVKPDNVNTQLSSSAARLSLLMAELTKAIGDGSDAALKNDQALFKDMQAQRQKAMDKAADDYDAQVAKAEKINKTMGCIGKVVGYLLTAVSIIALPFTGGASMALAVIGIGLAAADGITSAVTGGKSLTEMAMAPVMSGVIQPLIELLTKVIAAALEAVGVPKEKAQLIGGIIAAVYVAIATIVMMVAISVMAKSPAASRAIAKMAQTTIGKALKAFVQPLAKALAKPASKFDAAQIKQFGKMAEYGGAGLSAVGSSVQAGGGIAQGVYTRNAAYAEADLLLSRGVMKQLDRLLRHAAEQFSDMKNTGNDLTVVASEAAQRHADVARSGLRRMRG